MSPFLKDGDLLTLHVVSPAEVRVGDIVLYQTDSGLPLVHRVLARRTLAGLIVFSIRGDAARGLCDIVDASRVMARVETVERGPRSFVPGTWRYRIPALVWALTPMIVRRGVIRLARLPRGVLRRTSSVPEGGNGAKSNGYDVASEVRISTTSGEGRNDNS